MKTRFWELYGPDKLSKCAEWVQEDMDLETIECPLNPDHRGAGSRLTDLSVWLTTPRVENFVWTWQSECLIQDHVLQFFRTQGFTGYEVKPVKASFTKKSDQQPPKLWEVVVTGWGGIAPEESGVKLTYVCEGCGYCKYTGYSHPEKLIDEKQWDGSDFFMVWPMPNFIFVSDRVATAIDQEGFSGVQLIAPGDIEPTDSLRPGRLRWCMPDARAREIGEPLGIY